MALIFPVEYLDDIMVSIEEVSENNSDFEDFGYVRRLNARLGSTTREWILDSTVFNLIKAKYS
jgi:hypothetical protein